MFLSFSCEKDNSVGTDSSPLALTSVIIGFQENGDVFDGIDPMLSAEILFNEDIDPNTAKYITLKDESDDFVNLKYAVSKSMVKVTGVDNLDSYSKYSLTVGTGVKSVSGHSLQDQRKFELTTALDSSDKFERITDEALLTKVQKKTFRYFWDLGHHNCGMALERSTSVNTVTTGGTGFGILSMIVGIERGFISRSEGLERVAKIVKFLADDCKSYHGAFAHWINGSTGETIGFSSYDDGADIVETSFLFEGLLAARAYFNSSISDEVSLRRDITSLWEKVEWTWFQREGSNALYWHWSPNYGWKKNMRIKGWNEALIAYVLAASSPTFPITRQVYDEGWADNGKIVNGATFYGYELPLGNDYGGPLFFTHYSFLGLNPNALSDEYADYWTQNRHHSLINYCYCVDNPKDNEGYSSDCWGLTASDGNEAYSAHSPTNDLGVISPTAAISSMPYVPEESLRALRFFYYKLGDRIWTDYGFVDAFNPGASWFDSQYIAIDQGPIAVMIENYRTGLIWNLFMSIDEIRTGLSTLGFHSTIYNF